MTCSTPIGPGFCENTSQTCSGGSFVSGHCPGAADIECCVATCSTPSGAGFCSWTGSTCPGGNYSSGFCPGPADIECCVAPCSTPSGSGHCEYTTSSCSGSFEAGYCPGPSNYEVPSDLPYFHKDAWCLLESVLRHVRKFNGKFNLWDWTSWSRYIRYTRRVLLELCRVKLPSNCH